MTPAQAGLLAALKEATYFLDQIRVGNAFSEHVLWTKTEAYRDLIRQAERAMEREGRGSITHVTLP